MTVIKFIVFLLYERRGNILKLNRYRHRTWVLPTLNFNKSYTLQPKNHNPPESQNPMFLKFGDATSCEFFFGVFSIRQWKKSHYFKKKSLLN